jgi:hypothetical protein
LLSVHIKNSFITYPYDGNEEIHGFERRKMADYCGVDFVNKICLLCLQPKDLVDQFLY